MKKISRKKNIFRHLRATGLATAAMMAGQLAFGAGQTNNYELRAVPKPGEVKIDGKLDEWDLSGEMMMCYDLSTLLDKYSVKAACMYDKDYLYLSFRFKDKTPMVNHIDPVNTPGDGWKSDSIELRMKSDIISNWETWHYTDRNIPWASISYGACSGAVVAKENPDRREVPDATKEGVKIAFKADVDKGGYVEELAIPWKLVTRKGNSLGAGQKMNLGIQANWGAPSGINYPAHRLVDLINKNEPQREFFWANADAWGDLVFMAKGNLKPAPSIGQLSEIEKWQDTLYSTQGPVRMEYELPEAGYVTLVVETPEGKRIKNLIGDYPRKKGKNTDFWDGTDDNGRVVPPGKYRMRGLYHKELDLLYQFSYGSPGNPAWNTSDEKGGWLSNEWPPFAVTSDAEGIYVAAPFAEGETAVMKIDYNGRKQWGVRNINGGMLARYGDWLYMLVGCPTIAWGGPPQNEAAIVRIDAKTGKYAPFPDGKYMHTIAQVRPAKEWLKLREPLAWMLENKAFDAGWCMRQTMGLASDGKRIYASLYHENKIIVVDPVEGKTTGEFKIDKPVGLACDDKGTLYAISGKNVVKVSQDGQTSPLITENLEAPIGLAVDSTGNIHVSDWGKSMCVKVFASDGRFLKDIGTKGGRKLNGPYEPEGFFLPWSLSIDRQDRLWVTEYSNIPKRISVWRNDHLVKEYCGTAGYGTMCAQIDRHDPTRAFLYGNICEVDWEKGLWRVIGSYWPSGEIELTGANILEFVSMPSIQTLEYNGRKFLVAVGSTGTICLYEDLGNTAKPLAAAGWVANLLDSTATEKIPDFILRNIADEKTVTELRKSNPTAFEINGPTYEGVPSQSPHYARNNILSRPDLRSQFIWSDGNGDGKVQEEEIVFFAPDKAGGLNLGFRWRAGIGSDLALYPAAQAKGMSCIWKLPVKEWNKFGAPVYDYKDAKLLVSEKVNQGSGDSQMAWVDRKGDVLLMGESPMSMFDTQGKLLWTYPNKWPGVHGSHKANQAKRGSVIGPLFVMGSTDLEGDQGEVFCLRGNLGESYLLTTDGLYVGSLLRDCRSGPDALPDNLARGMSVKDCSAGGEPFGGSFFKNPADGKIYMEGPVDENRAAPMVCEVKGLETIRKLPVQNIEFTQSDYESAAKIVEKKVKDEKKMMVVGAPVQAVKDAPDLGTFKWGEKYMAKWAFSNARSASAAFTFDEKNLYLCFRDVTDDSPMVNTGADSKILYKSGDALEFELRTKPDDENPDIIPGDIRLVISVFEGKPVAVLYAYQQPGTTGKPISFGSPVGKIDIDVVRVIEGARINIERQADRYNLFATIPLEALGFKPEKGKSYKGDFGVVYSDKKGAINELRMYWSNPVTGMVNDLYVESKIQPNLWGSFVVE